MARKRKIDRPLRNDVRHLGALLGEVIIEREGRRIFELEEEVRRLAIARRRGPQSLRASAARELSAILERLELPEAEAMIRAFATYFQLVNLAEQHHRIRRARAHAMNLDTPPQRGSIEAILRLARERGVSAAQARATIASLEVTLTLTAHPTQAARRTILEKLDRIADRIEERDRCDQTPREAADSLRRIREEITSLWLTDELRRERPTVGDEVKNVLWYAEKVLWDRLPALPKVLAEAFEAVYGEPLGMVPAPLRLHSWVGGDMDGNPLVIPEVVEDAMRVHQGRALRLLLAKVQALGGALSISSRNLTPPQPLLDSLAADEARMPEVAAHMGPRTEGEPWRRKLRFMEARLAAALVRVEASRAGERDGQVPAGMAWVGTGIAPVPVAEGSATLRIAYTRPEELVADLEILEASLDPRLHLPPSAAPAWRPGPEGPSAQGGGGDPDAPPIDGEEEPTQDTDPPLGLIAIADHVRDLLIQVRSIGFHLLELELRVLASDAVAAARSIEEGVPPSPAASRLIEALQKVADAQAFGGERACRALVLSMAQTTEDVLAALDCAKHSGLWDEALGCARLDVVPLFETLEALDQAPAVMRALFHHPTYRRHVACRGQQEVMVGYSDSGKEVGLLAATAALWRAQTTLVELAKEEGIPLRIFHGRGESVARGGGPAQQAILALPAGSIACRYKATEQGEALDHKYARPELAQRSLELIVGGALLHSMGAQSRPSPEEEARFLSIFDELAEVGRRVYRELVWEEPRFVEFHQAATPLEEISGLPIGSRPAKRSAGGLDALRAIPWVFSWTQNRSILPGWYGVGSALGTYARRPDGAETLRTMYERWPLFHTVISNVEMVLAKSDLAIARRYAALASEEAREAIWPRIEAEYRLTLAWVKRITESQRLLDQNPPLQRSIELRNPYVDPMSFLQVELLRRKRAGREGCGRPLLLTLNGIAAGLRNTG